ncbi:IclR family transcriptional regulator C-terminal domain-containing protein [Streptomyces sp. T-3]|nr:IclR family transcriptional regulator C-terminal domain-containing protein [Streptomyces sp. T-3]
MSRFNEDSGNRQAPVLPDGLVELMDTLAGPHDFWYRPDGDFGKPAETVEPDRSARQRANSLYRLGSRALARGELREAADWLGEAAAAGHPGALFRLAVVALRAGEDWCHEAWFLIAEAARMGHGDASGLLRAFAHRRPDAEAGPLAVEDAEYFDEARQLLGVSEEMLVPEEAPWKGPDQPGSGESGVPADAGTDAEAGTPQLFQVPAPVLPPLASEDHQERVMTPNRMDDQCRPAGPQEPVPTLWLPGLETRAVPGVPVASGSSEAPGKEPWWSANALRPALLSDMARSRPPRPATPRTWQAAQQARDLLHLISSADGIDTRTLAQRARMSLNTTINMVDWLRDQHLITTIGGAHHPSSVMRMTTHPDGDLLQKALSDLRDELGAAIYLSSYTDGEIHIHEAAYSHTAPPVDEWAPFTDTGHASAVGKCLLAQLDFDTRMEHLSRYPSIQLTERTITNPRDLFAELDEHGPHAAQFDLLEYSQKEVCVAYSLGLPGRTSSIALSLPAGEHGRLIPVARSLSKRATGILLAHLIADDTTDKAARELKDGAVPEPRRALP